MEVPSTSKGPHKKKMMALSMLIIFLKIPKLKKRGHPSVVVYNLSHRLLEMENSWVGSTMAET